MAETAKTLQLPSSSDRTRFPPNFYRIGSAIVVLVIWEIAGRASDSLSIPTLGATVGAWVELMVSGRLPMALLISGIAMAVGLLMSILVGCAVGLAIGWVKYLEEALDIYIGIMLVLPMLAFAPVVTAVFGLNLFSRIIIVFLFAVVVIVVNVATGVKTINPDLILMARSFGATQKNIFQKIMLPGATPAIIAGIRLGLGRAFLGMIAGEMLVMAVGVGYLLLFHAGRFDPHYTFAILLTVIALAATLMSVAKKIEARLVRWNPAGTQSQAGGE